MRPPASKKAAMTRAHSSRSAGSLPTLKVIQVPSPTIGISSRVEGIGRRAGGPAGHAERSARARQRPSPGRSARTFGVSSSSDAPSSRRANSRARMRRVTKRHRQLPNTKLPIRHGTKYAVAPSSIYDDQASLDELQSLQTCVTVLADDDVAVDGNAARSMLLSHGRGQVASRTLLYVHSRGWRRPVLTDDRTDPGRSGQRRDALRSLASISSAWSLPQ